MAADVTEHDGRQRRCPMLGHEVRFAYCRKPGRELPCGKVFDCWYEAFDVEGFLRGVLSEEEIARVLAPRQDKTASLVELIERARRRQREGNE